MYPTYNEPDPKKRIDLELEGTYLALMVGGVPGDAIDLARVVADGESLTRLKVDLDSRKLVYENENYVSGKSTIPDTIAMDQLAQAIELDDLGNVSAETPNEGDLLVFKESHWQSATPVIDDLVSVLGLNTAGDIVKTDSSGIGGGGGGISLPIGSTIIWPGAENTIPSGYVPQDGRTLNRIVYADLFTLIGTSYGSGDNSTTFNIPNTKGRVVAGLDVGQSEFDVLGETAGSKTVALSSSQMPSHYHSINPPTTGTTSDTHNHNMTVDVMATSGGGSMRTYSGGSGQQMRFGKYSTDSDSHSHTVNIGAFNSSSAGSGAAHSNLQPTITQQYVMRII